MRSKGKYLTYFILLIVIAGIAYTACKNVIPAQEKVEKTIELKLNK